MQERGKKKAVLLNLRSCVYHVWGLTENIEFLCKKMESSHIRVPSKPYYTIRNVLVHVKNKIPMEDKTGVMFEILCGRCEQV